MKSHFMKFYFGSRPVSPSSSNMSLVLSQKQEGGSKLLKDSMALNARRPAWTRKPLLSGLAALGLSAAALPFLSAPSLARIAPDSGDEAQVTILDDELHFAPNSPQWRFVRLGKATSGPAFPPPPVHARITLDEQRTSAVSAPLSGRVEQVLVRVGDSVVEGARLALIRSPELVELDREIELAQQAVATRSRVVERLKDLLLAQAVSEREVFEAEAELKQAQLDLRGAKARRKNLSVTPHNGNSFWLQAPTSGTVLELDVARGQEVGPDRDPLLRMGDLDEVIVSADVAESAALDVAVGAEVEIRYPGGTRKGQVEAVSGVVDPQRRTVAVRVRTSNSDRRLRPNGWVEVVFPAVGEERIRVPSKAVVTDGPRSVVFVLADQVFRRTPVILGRENGSQVEILDGLSDGEQVVTEGALLLLNQIDLEAP